MHATGTGQNSPRKRIASRMSSGPVEQFSPITSTFRPSSVVSTDEMSVPRSILRPLGTWAPEGGDGNAPPGSLGGRARPEARRLDLEDVLGRLDDQEVRAAVDQPRGLLLEDLDQLAEADLAERRILGGRQVS